MTEKEKDELLQRILTAEIDRDLVFPPILLLTGSTCEEISDWQKKTTICIDKLWKNI